MLRDKDYLITRDDLIFNVIGYEHAPNRATANLKYVKGKKWTAGYLAAIAFLQDEYPSYVDGWISVPRDLVKSIFRPQEGLASIRARATRNRLEQAAVDLAHECSDFFQIPAERFGLTDSLLWGRGNAESDVDLVVYGRANAVVVLNRILALFNRRGFERFTPENFTRQAVRRDADLEELCRRKANKGLYRGVRFSLRAVREPAEIAHSGPYDVVGPLEIRARVVDNSESLFFPITYRLDCKLDAVSFLMRHEALFRIGGQLTVRGILERGARDRVIVGGLDGRDDKMEVRRSSDPPRTDWGEVK